MLGKLTVNIYEPCGDRIGTERGEGAIRIDEKACGWVGCSAGTRTRRNDKLSGGEEDTWYME